MNEPNLTNLTIRECKFFPHIPLNHSNVQFLSFRARYSDEIGERALKEFLTLGNLKELHVDMCDHENFTDEVIAALTTSCRQLENVEISSMFMEAFFFTYPLFFNVLYFSACPRVTDAGIFTLVSGLSNLKTLSLNYLDNTNVIIPLEVEEVNSNLQNLAVRSLQLSEHAFKKISLLKNLRNLKIQFPDCLPTHEDIGAIQAGCQYLEEFYFKGKFFLYKAYPN